MYLSLITRVLFSKENFKVSAFILTSFTVILMLSIISVRSIAERKIDDFHRELHTLEMALKNDKLDDIECKELDWMLSQLYDKDRYLIASPEHYIIVDPNKSCTIRTRSSQSNIGYLFENYEFWFLPSESNNKVYIGMKDYPTGTNISNFNSGFYSNLVLRNFISLSLVNQSNSGEISLVDNRVENIISYNLVDYKNISISISPRLSLIILAILIPVYYPVLILLYTIPKGICKTKQSSIKIVEHDKLESTLVYQIIIKPHTISSSINKLCYAHSLIKSIVCTKYNTYGKNIIAYDFTNIDFSAIPYILRLAIIALLKNSSIIITDKTFSHYPSRGVEIIVLINDLNQLSTDSSYFNNEHVNILLNTDTSFISTCQLKEILSRSMVLLESIRVGSYLTKLATLNQTVFNKK
ncbi:hypothetical protein JCM19233_5537 [Vibrio astriarenae]|nr:hypothetical protein JCM19233_5537 [Vibrio sp. C7]